MLRKAISLVLALIVCAMIVAGIDCVRHAMAIGRLEKKSVTFEIWHYRFTGVDVPDSLRDATPGTWREKLRRLIATPQVAFLWSTVDETRPGFDRSIIPDLTPLRIEEFTIGSYRGLTSAVASELSKVSSIHWLSIDDCDLANEDLNRLWTQMPNLEVVMLEGTEFSDRGFQDVRAARNLGRLVLHGMGINDATIAHLREAPGLEELDMTWVGVTKDSASLLAAMPALRKVKLQDVSAGTAIAVELRMLNPKIAVEVVQ